MILKLNSLDYRYEIESLCNLFFPFEKIKITEEGSSDEASDDRIIVSASSVKNNDRLNMHVSVSIDGEATEASGEYSIDEINSAPINQHGAVELSSLLFDILCKRLEYTPKWGMLIGVRPVKLFKSLSDKLGEAGAVDYLRNTMKVSEEKINLARCTSEIQKSFLRESVSKSYSLYVSIPFCPTRCSYCSFIATSVQQTRKLIPEYIRLLGDELRRTAQIASELGLKLESIYFGGGTPTAISAEQLSELLGIINTEFDLSSCRELTVEAGRPDTITEEKLMALKNGGVTRISINPQTMHDKTLEKIGRKHTVAQTVEAFELARKCGMGNINMDLIAGLPGESFDDFKSTIDSVIAMNPESITVHTLSLKRSSDINQSGARDFKNDAVLLSRMLDYAQDRLTGNNYNPYYLYRQSRMIGNLENIGWSKKGFENLYNIYIMEENQSIFACGAGASSKITGADGRLQRVFNFKYPFEYNSRFNEIIDRKNQLKSLYNEMN